MLFQAGRIIAMTADGTLHVFRPSSFELKSETSEITADGFPFDVSPIQDLDSAIAKETFTLTLKQKSIDNLDMQMSFNRRAQMVPTIDVPYAFSATVPATAPYEITVASLALNQTVYAKVEDELNPIYLSQGTIAPTAGKFQVAAGKVVFHSSQAGKVVAVAYMKTETNIEMIGGTAPNVEYGSMSFSGILKGTRTTKQIWLPKISRTSGVAIGATGKDATELEMIFKPTTIAGWSTPFAVWTPSA